nr:hypothetical protein [Leptospira weilii]
MKNSEKPTNKAFVYSNILLFSCIIVSTTMTCGLLPGKHGNKNNWWMALAGLVPGTSFPSSGSGVGSGNGGPGSAPAPEGSDLFSISTKWTSPEKTDLAMQNF